MTDDLDFQRFKTQDAASYDLVTEQFDYFTERLTRPLAARMLEFAGIVSNEKILDIGTGTGIVAFQAALKINNAGTVDGIDLSSEMLTKAQEKKRQLKIEQKITFHQMDAEALNFDDNKFDITVSLFALLHFPNPFRALQEIFRVLRPGGRLVIAIGSGIPIFSLTGWLHILKKTPNILQGLRGKLLIAPHFLNNFVDKHIPKTDHPEESHLASHHRTRNKNVRRLIEKAGFNILKTDWYGHEELIETPEEFWEIQRTFSSIARKRLSTISQNKFDLLRDNFLKECRRVQEQGGCLIYPFGAFYISAIRQ